ncbi:MucR family transcriptional regulator [Sphingobium estronivorans]|uniref:MucR family transcriptional regulator n=1 Tax=Sphingobium estronivorans TaxID=1577690 RepID=UPI00123B9DB6|nr:MucR family transcriptional regulator [Sphingobium estronivorans]
MAETEEAGVMSLTVTLLSAYFVNNTVPSSELPALVEGTRRALLGDATVAAAAPLAESKEDAVEAAASASEFKPAVTLEESLASPDHILSLIDGKPYKALKRHLSAHGLTTVEYRARYDLPADYPMVAPGYSASRREVAIRLGLGGKRKGVSAPPTPAPEEVATGGVETSTALPGAEEAPAEAAPVRRTRAKGAPSGKAASAPTKVKRKAASGTAKPVAVKAASKPRRSRAPKDSVGTATPPEVAPAEAPLAG